MSVTCTTDTFFYKERQSCQGGRVPCLALQQVAPVFCVSHELSSLESSTSFSSVKNDDVDCNAIAFPEFS